MTRLASIAFAAVLAVYLYMVAVSLLARVGTQLGTP